MDITGRTLIKGAMRAIGASAAGETPESDEFRDCFELLNQLLDSWRLDRLLITHTKATTHTLTAGVSTYTIGPGGTLDQARPQTIDKASAYPDANAAREVPVEILNLDRWMRLSNKTQPGPYPRGLYYDHDYAAGLGAISLAPVPDVSGVRLVLFVPTPISTFSTLDTTYSVADGVARMLRLNLAVEIAPEFPGAPQDTLQEVIRLAGLAKAEVMRSNAPERELNLDEALRPTSRRFDIRNLD